MEQLLLPLSEPATIEAAEVQPGQLYHCWSIDTDESQAALSFQRRYGAWPETIIEWKNMIWLGPIPEKSE
jgi:hypothetical protein